MIERCEDYRRIKKFIDWNMLISNEIYYMMSVKNGVDLGVLTFHPWRDGFLMHASLGEKCRGKVAKQFARDCFKWVFDHDLCDIIYAASPKDNKPAQRIAVSSGMEYIESGETERFYKIDKRQVESLNYVN